MSLAARLRSETRDDHDRIELAFDLDARLASPAAYRDLLVRLHGFHSGFEAAAAPGLAGTPLARYLDRGALIARDIAVLDASAHPGESRDPGLAAGGLDPGFRRDERREGPRPGLQTRAEALGALYVVEGSILGGVLIAKEVGKRLGIGPETGAAFFAGHGRDTARTWAEFCRLLDAEGGPEVDDRAVVAARGTYGAMQGWLCDRTPAPDRTPAQTPAPDPVPLPA